MKKILSLILALAMVFCLCACGGSAGGPKADGEVSVFWFTFGDTYLATVRTAMNAILDQAGIVYQDYDANSNQTTQTEQVQTALAKGSRLLIVNVVDTGSNDAAQTIISMAKEKNVPVIFFNRSVEQEVVESYDKCVFVGTNYEEAGHMQGELIGKFLVNNYDSVDLNGDGVISYVMFKGQEGNMEAIARTQYGVEDADAVLAEAGKPALSFYDPNNANKYLVDQNGNWSAQAANEYMTTILSQYNVANGNAIELVIANNDQMASGAISALQTVGFNLGADSTTIPVFGVDAIDEAKDLIDRGIMTGTIKQDAEGMAQAIAAIAYNFSIGAHAFAGIDDAMKEGSWKVAIPYGVYGSADALSAAPAAAPAAPASGEPAASAEPATQAPAAQGSASGEAAAPAAQGSASGEAAAPAAQTTAPAAPAAQATAPAQQTAPSAQGGASAAPAQQAAPATGNQSGAVVGNPNPPMG